MVVGATKVGEPIIVADGRSDRSAREFSEALRSNSARRRAGSETPLSYASLSVDESQVPIIEDRAKRRCRTISTIGGSMYALGTLVVVVMLRHARRSVELHPFLAAVNASYLCRHRTRQASSVPTCLLEFSEEDADTFDLHPAENPLLGFLYGQLARADEVIMKEILSGAHARIEDPQGSYYHFLTTLPHSTQRISSHTSDMAQYGIDGGKIVSEMLVGKLGNVTWLQLEGSTWNPQHRPVASFGHVLDFIEYRITRRQIGPLGTSEFSEWHPIFQGLPVSMEDACVRHCPTRANFSFSSGRIAVEGNRRLRGLFNAAENRQPVFG